MELADVTRLREELKTTKRTHSLTGLRKEFEKRKATEWAAIRDALVGNPQEVTDLEQQLAKTVSILFNQGTSKRDLCTAFGTKNYGTINDLIEQGDSLDIEIEKPSSLEASLDPELTAEHGVNIWIVEANNYGIDKFTGTVRLYPDSEGFPTVVGDITDEFRGTQLHRETAGNTSGDFEELWESVGGYCGV